MSYSYSDPNHAHAVTGAGANSYAYDANGNMTQRVIGSATYQLLYDAENRMVEVKKNSTTIASFVYDGDGGRAQSIINGTTTTFVGNYYEVSGATVTKYYYAGGQRVAMRAGTSAYYLLSDHLGRTSLTADGAGNQVAELRYKAFGEVRYSSGTTPSGYTYTGQYSNVWKQLDRGMQRLQP